MKFKEYKGSVDPDESFWREYGERSTYFLVVIRIFYEVGNPAYEEIGIVRNSKYNLLVSEIMASFDQIYL